MLDWFRESVARCLRSLGYCRDALASMYRGEPSFRLELLAGAVLAAVLVLCPWPVWKKLAMFAVFLLIPLAEVLNTAVEDLCNLVTRDHHPLVKCAKDKGALAVLLAILVNALALLALLLC